MLALGDRCRAMLQAAHGEVGHVKPSNVMLKPWYRLNAMYENSKKTIILQSVHLRLAI